MNLEYSKNFWGLANRGGSLISRDWFFAPINELTRVDRIWKAAIGGANNSEDLPGIHIACDLGGTGFVDLV